LDKGNLATVGRAFAILDVHGVKISGLIAWIGWLVIHILYLIGFRNRAVVLFSWMWAYITYQRGARLITFSPDSSESNNSGPQANTRAGA
jgi:NADH dehydrogenase